MTDTEDFLKIMSQGDDLATRLRAWAEIISIPSGPFVNEDLKFAADEIERLRERCEAYKGQVEAGAGERERLLAILRDARDHVPWDVLKRIDAALGNHQ